MIDFVKDFHIPREDFAGARTLDAQKLTEYGSNITTEYNEFVNTDILYSFDEDIIKAYYLRSNG